MSIRKPIRNGSEWSNLTRFKHSISAPLRLRGEDFISDQG
jgi:hypothetical protein